MPVSTARVLVAVVDDDAGIRRALQRLLRSAGFDGRAFASGNEFLAALPISGLRCVILDVHMPELGGIELQHRLDACCPPVPVIFITGHDDAEAQRRALAQKPIAFLSKPIDDRQLLDAIAMAG